MHMDGEILIFANGVRVIFLHRGSEPETWLSSILDLKTGQYSNVCGNKEKLTKN